jgi:superfamily I DNA/RNA helicase
VVVDTDAEADLADGVRLATMHRVKGLEFPRMLLAGVQSGTMPLKLSESALPDNAAREDHVQQERRLLFVAATRARDELVVTGFGAPSPLVAG